MPNGLDPASRRDIWNEVRRLSQRLGVAISLTTQYLEEANIWDTSALGQGLLACLLLVTVTYLLAFLALRNRTRRA